ncbi:MAG: GbsR/MarR family transcriptional regulator [Egibacteraceae bacterium]
MQAESRLEEQVGFADEVGLLYEDFGFPRVWGRVLGWLLVCEPDFQSAERLATVLHASRGSISTTTRSLVRAALVERHTIRGDRRTYYRIRPGSWTSVFEEQIQTAKRMRELAERGLELLSHEPAERRRRLKELHDLTTFYGREAPALLARWHREHP